MHQLFSSKEAEVNTPDGKSLKVLFGEEGEKKKKEKEVKDASVTPGPKAMNSLFDPEGVKKQKEFDGRITAIPKTPDPKVMFHACQIFK